jgi:hypothetical protein
MDYVNGQSFFAIFFPSGEWYPYPFFYRLEGARVLDELSAMHGREFQLTDPYLFVPSTTFLFSCFVRYMQAVVSQRAFTCVQ